METEDLDQIVNENKNSYAGIFYSNLKSAKLLKYIRGKTTSSSLWIIYKISNKLEEFDRIEQFKSIRRRKIDNGEIRVIFSYLSTGITLAKTQLLHLSFRNILLSFNSLSAETTQVTKPQLEFSRERYMPL